MEIRHLRLIKTIADEKGITKTGEKLHLTQSAISHQLEDLEERLRVKVFYRSKNQWQLTEEGQILYNTACNVLAQIDSAFNQIQALSNGETGLIRISTECYTSYHWLPACLSRIKLVYPSLDIKIVIKPDNKPLEKLHNNQIDLVITSDPHHDKSIRYFELFKDEVYAVLHREHPLSTKKFLSASDFTDQCLIIHSYPLTSVTVYNYFLKPEKIEPKEVLALPLTEAALEMVKARLGIMTMPGWALKPFVQSSELVLVRLGSHGLVRKHYAAIRHEDAAKKYISDFIRNLKEELTY